MIPRKSWNEQYLFRKIDQRCDNMFQKWKLTYHFSKMKHYFRILKLQILDNVFTSRYIVSFRFFWWSIFSLEFHAFCRSLLILKLSTIISKLSFIENSTLTTPAQSETFHPWICSTSKFSSQANRSTRRHLAKYSHMFRIIDFSCKMKGKKWLAANRTGGWSLC